MTNIQILVRVDADIVAILKKRDVLEKQLDFVVLVFGLLASGFETTLLFLSRIVTKPLFSHMR